MPLEVGKIIEGKVIKITDFGAFVKINETNEVGLVHISEVSSVYVKSVKDHLNLNDSVKVKVISIVDGKINLSIKQAQVPFKKSGPMEMDFSQKRNSKDSFEDMIGRFIKESDEKLQHWKKNFEPKRGSKKNY